MSVHRKHWSKDEKLEILNYSENNGVSKASREYKVSTGAIYKWRENYELYGESGLMRKGKETIIQEADYKRLKRENDQLKLLLAEKELRIKIQNELLKKSHSKRKR